MSYNSHDDAHADTNTSSRRGLAVAVLTLGVPMVLIAAMVHLFGSPSASSSVADDSERAVQERIQKIGAVKIGSAVKAPRSGEEVFKAQCTNCHSAGLAGAPKLGDTAAWAPRIAKGYDALLTSALKGKGNMGAQGGGEFDDAEVGRALVYMANNAGGKLVEPKSPAPAAAAPAAK